jgi:hypothetical protein
MRLRRNMFFLALRRHHRSLSRFGADKQPGIGAAGDLIDAAAMTKKDALIQAWPQRVRSL